jgi:preprotein translocase subunit SecY
MVFIFVIVYFVEEQLVKIPIARNKEKGLNFIKWIV